MNFAELVIRTAHIEQFNPMVNVREPLLRLQCLAHDRHTLGLSLAPSDLAFEIKRYVHQAVPTECVSQVADMPALYKADDTGDWMHDEKNWTGAHRVGGLLVKHGRFVEKGTGIEFFSSKCDVLNRDGSGTLVELHTEYGNYPGVHKALELLEHEMFEAFYVGGVRILDPHMDPLTRMVVTDAVRDMLSEGCWSEAWYL